MSQATTAVVSMLSECLEYCFSSAAQGYWCLNLPFDEEHMLMDIVGTNIMNFLIQNSVDAIAVEDALCENMVRIFQCISLQI